MTERECSVTEAATEFDAVDKLFDGAYLLLLPESDRTEAQETLRQLGGADSISDMDYRIMLADTIIRERLIHHVTLARPYEGSDTLYLESGWGLLEEGDRLLFNTTTIKLKSVVVINDDYRAKIEPMDTSLASGSIGLVRQGDRRFRVGASDWTMEHTKKLSQLPKTRSQIDQIYTYFQLESEGVLDDEPKKEVGIEDLNPFAFPPDSLKSEDSSTPTSSTGETSGSEVEPSESIGNGTNLETPPLMISLP
ncbi:MAG: hypothetical protein ACRC62_15270 [Microcoleus sp.]